MTWPGAAGPDVAVRSPFDGLLPDEMEVDPSYTVSTQSPHPSAPFEQFKVGE